MESKYVCFDAFGLNSSFTSLYRYQKGTSISYKWIFNSVPDRVRIDVVKTLTFDSEGALILFLMQ